MIRHIVLTKFRPGTGEDRIADLYDQLAALTAMLPGAHNFTGGRSQSPEQIERGYMHGFVIDFDGWPDLETYATHPTHLALAEQLVAQAQGGARRGACAGSGGGRTGLKPPGRCRKLAAVIR